MTIQSPITPMRIPLNDSIQQSQPVTSLPTQIEAQTRESTTTDLLEDERNYTINADHDPVLDDHMCNRLPETQAQTRRSTTTDLSDDEQNYTTGQRNQPEMTSYETDYVYSDSHTC